MEGQHYCLTWINVGFEMSSNPQYKIQFPQQGLGNLITRTSLLHLEQLLMSFRVREMTNIFRWYRQHHVMGSAPSISTLLFQTGITVASLSSYPMKYFFTDYRHKARSWLQKGSISETWQKLHTTLFERERDLLFFMPSSHINFLPANGHSTSRICIYITSLRSSIQMAC